MFGIAYLLHWFFIVVFTTSNYPPEMSQVGYFAVSTLCFIYLKSKAVPLQAWTDPEGLWKFRFPDFVTTAQDGGMLSALRTGRLYPQEMLPVLISVGGWVDPRAIARMEGFYINEKKIPMTPAGIEPATFRCVAQHLNHCATAVPLEYCRPCYI